MKQKIANILQNILNIIGYRIIKNSKYIYLVQYDAYISESDKIIINQVRPYTMTSIPRMLSLKNSVQYIVKNKIPGDIVECGVWRGGSMMLIALQLIELNDTSRNLYLYDTFEGMSQPTDNDLSIYGDNAKTLLNKHNIEENIWCYASLDEVKENIKKIGYPMDKVHFIKGKVEDTLSTKTHDSIALLRLDTDWYESTILELQKLFPRLVEKGILIVDDYGHWKGARQAVDEYFQNNQTYIHLIDETAILIQK
ncbi:MULTISPECIES: TylF/MycF/NovP-related O-methyltransferase [Acinetobacter]|uniref:TylF/MycF/NovP-related O-methyltransferase n=1 Tax=Acinetobacter TaxID=469 RepID=UPI0005C528E9|nr:MULTISPECIES: TylF/MycF/NovP-related O-methyltransferase [Acinetobacter]